MHYFYEDPEYLWDYLQQGTVIVDDPDRICEYLDGRSKELKEDFQTFLERGQAAPRDMELICGKEDFYKIYKKESVYVLTPFPKEIKGVEMLSEVHHIQSRQMISFSGRLDLLESELKSYVAGGYQIVIAASSDERLDNLKEFTERIGLRSRIEFRKGSLSVGMDFPEEKICYISENDIFSGKKQIKSKRKEKNEVRADSVLCGYAKRRLCGARKSRNRALFRN